MNPPFLFKICWRRVFTSGGNPFLTCRGVPGQSGRVTRFRPCIDLHDGRVKQIVGGSLTRDEAGLRTNFVSDRDAAWYADLYRRDGLTGGHVIKLGPGNEETALSALAAWPGGLQVGAALFRKMRNSGLKWEPATSSSRPACLTRKENFCSKG